MPSSFQTVEFLLLRYPGIPINRQDFATNPQVQQGLKNAFLRLAGLKLAADAVTLNWACAGEALAKFASKLRRLGSEVRLCFEIQIEGHFGSWNKNYTAIKICLYSILPSRVLYIMDRIVLSCKTVL